MASISSGLALDVDDVKLLAAKDLLLDLALAAVLGLVDVLDNLGHARLLSKSQGKTEQVSRFAWPEV